MCASAASGGVATRRCSPTTREVAARRRPVPSAGSTPARSSATAWRTAAGDRPTSRAASSTAAGPLPSGGGPPAAASSSAARRRTRATSSRLNRGLRRRSVTRPFSRDRPRAQPAAPGRRGCRIGSLAPMARSSAPGGDLFSAAAEEHLARQAPLAARLRPQRLDDIVGQDELLGPGRPLRVLVESDRLSSVILWGPPGTGKTTLAQVIARHTAKAYEQLSAVSATVKDVRDTVARAEARLGERGQGTILFLDEVHRFNKAQQDALLPSVESGLLVLVG